MKKTMIIVLGALVFALAASAIVTRIVRANQPLMPGDRVVLDKYPGKHEANRVGVVAATRPDGSFDVLWDNSDTTMNYGPRTGDLVTRQ